MALLPAPPDHAQKKTGHAAEQDRADVLSRREAWFEGQLDLDPHRLVFIDETGASTKMARLHGRAPRDERLRAAIPHGHWKTTTFVGALRLTGITAPMVLDGPMTGEWFLAYTEQVLVPTLRPGDVVILNNLPAHKGTAVREAVEAAGATLLFLRHTRRTSTRSRTPSPSSRRSCAKRPPARRSPLAHHRRLPRCVHTHRVRELLRCRRL